MTDDDRVERFFEDERSAIHPLPTDEAHWASLVTENARTRRSRRMGYASGAAAAVLLVGGLGWALRPGPAQTNQTLPATVSSQTRSSVVPPTSRTASGATTTPSPSSSPSSAATTTTPPPATAVAVPANFRVVSMSNVGGGTIYALGRTTCGGTACPALARSTDRGSTWQLVSSFPGVSPGPTGPADTVGTDGSLTQVRFANAEVGWVFGGGLKMTTDGGRTWADLEHSGQAVISLETDGKQVVASTSSGPCDGTTCAGNVGVEVSAVSTWRPSSPGGAPQSGPVTSADVAFHDGTAFVSPIVRGLGTTGTPGAWRVGSTIQEVPSTCQGEVPGPVSLVAPAAGDTLFAVCPDGGAAGTVGYHVAASTDDGRSWSPVSTDVLTLANSGITSFAATDATHLLAVSGGSTALKGTLSVSSDGGTSWHSPATAPPTPAAGWSWVGAPGGSTLYAVPVGGAPGYWVSDDRGEHWRQVRVVGP